MSHFPASFDVEFWDIRGMQVKFVADPIEAINYLSEWRLEKDALIEAVLFAQSFYNECTANDPLGFDRVIAYARAARRLRDLFGHKGWHRDNCNNQTAIRNEDAMLRLYPCNFCSNTANPVHQPENWHDKGPAARSDTHANSQLPLPYLTMPSVIPWRGVKREEKYTTLLLGMNFEGDHPKAEISKPIRFEDGKFKHLEIRVPLLDGTPPPEQRVEEKPNDFFGEIDIPISRKL